MNNIGQIISRLEHQRAAIETGHHGAARNRRSQHQGIDTRKSCHADCATQEVFNSASIAKSCERGAAGNS